MDSIRGREAWHTSFGIRGGLAFYKVNDRYESWFDTRSLASLRYHQQIDEGNYERQSQFEIYPDRRVFVDSRGGEQPTAEEPLDDGSFLYFLRTIPLEVGKEYTFERYFRLDRNPVRIKVLRLDRVTVPAGTFDAVVVQPIIKTKGIFSENGRAEVWLSNDEHRIMLQMKSRFSRFSLNLFLKSFRLADRASAAPPRNRHKDAPGELPRATAVSRGRSGLRPHPDGPVAQRQNASCGGMRASRAKIGRFSGFYARSGCAGARATFSASSTRSPTRGAPAERRHHARRSRRVRRAFHQSSSISCAAGVVTHRCHERLGRDSRL